MHNNMRLFAALVSVVFAHQANAAIIPMTLSDMRAFPSSGVELIPLFTNSTATFEYDDVTNLLTQTGGTFDATIHQNNDYDTPFLYRHIAEGFVVGNGAPALGSYLCISSEIFNFCQALFLWQFDGFVTKIWDGSTLVIGNYPERTCPPEDICGLRWIWMLEAEPQVIPLPAAAWLFGSVIGLLALLRRRAYGAPSVRRADHCS